MRFAVVLHGCTCAGVRTRNKRRLECSCSMLALFHNFVLGFLSYNIWRRGWDHIVLYNYFLLFPTPYDLTSLRFVCLCFGARARGCVCKSHHGFTVARSVGEFDPSSESFKAYLERLDQFFVANDNGKCADDASAAVVRAANQKKLAMMISVIGKKTHSTLRDLCSPENPKEKTFEALSEVLQQNFTPKRLEVAKSYRFHRCCQEENESVLVYSARLRHLAATCNPQSVCVWDLKLSDLKKTTEGRSNISRGSPSGYHRRNRGSRNFASPTATIASTS